MVLFLVLKVLLNLGTLLEQSLFHPATSVSCSKTVTKSGNTFRTLSVSFRGSVSCSKSVTTLSYTFRTKSASFCGSVSRSKSVPTFGYTFRTTSVSFLLFLFPVLKLLLI